MIDAQQFAGTFEPEEQVRDRICRTYCFELVREATDRSYNILLAGLKVGAIQQPGGVWNDPLNPAWCHAIL
ncbi:hypothetical protein D3C79_871940 [compost metagenome]